MMPPTYDLICVAIYLGLTLGVGYAILCSVYQRRTRHWAMVAAFSFSLGAVGISFALFYSSLIGFKPQQVSLAGIATLALLRIGWLWRRKQLVLLSIPTPWRRPDALSLLGAISLGVIIIATLNLCVFATWPGLNDTDVFGIWLFKAKWISLAALRPIPAVFVDPTLSYSHQDYPLGMPFYVAGLYSLIGGIAESSAKLLCCPIYLSVGGMIYSTLRDQHRRAAALAITTVFCSAPTFCNNAGLLVGETFLIMALAGTATCLLRWCISGESRELILCGLFAASAAFCKNEGLAMLPIIAMITFFLAVKARKITEWMKSFVVAGMIILPWLIFRIFLPKTHEDYGAKLTRPTAFLQHIDRIGYVSHEMFSRLFDAPRQGLIWFVLIFSAGLGWRAFSQRSAIVLWIVLLIQLALYFATFIVTPWSVTELLPMIGPKLLTQASVIAVLLVGLHLHAVAWTKSDKSPALPTSG